MQYEVGLGRHADALSSALDVIGSVCSGQFSSCAVTEALDFVY